MRPWVRARAATPWAAPPPWRCWRGRSAGCCWRSTTSEACPSLQSRWPWSARKVGQCVVQSEVPRCVGVFPVRMGELSQTCMNVHCTQKPARDGWCWATCSCKCCACGQPGRMALSLSTVLLELMLNDRPPFNPRSKSSSHTSLTHNGFLRRVPTPVAMHGSCWMKLVTMVHMRAAQALPPLVLM